MAVWVVEDGEGSYAEMYQVEVFWVGGAGKEVHRQTAGNQTQERHEFEKREVAYHGLRERAERKSHHSWLTAVSASALIIAGARRGPQ